MEKLLSRYNSQTEFISTQPGQWGAAGGVGMGVAGASHQAAWSDPAQRAQQQAQRLYQQQLLQQQEQYRSQQRPSMHTELNAFPGYGNSLDAFAWDRQDAQLAPSFSQFANPGASSHRDMHPSVLAEQMLATGGLARDTGRDNASSALSLPTSSGTPRSGARAGPRRKASKQKKSPSGESHTMQRCLDVVEQLLEEEDAEPFAEPVDAKALGLDDYHNVIHNPMDLGTIKDKLNDEEDGYRGSAEVLRDVQQVWANCRAYNDHDDPIIDMCDNMERFFYQAWKQEGLPLPTGAGPALSRVQSGKRGQGQGASLGKPQEVDQHTKRKGFEEDAFPGHSSPVGQALSDLRGKASRQKGTGVTAASLSTVGSSQEHGGNARKRNRSGPNPTPGPAPPPYQESEKEKEAERKDQEAVKIWEKLQQQQRKAQQLIQAAQEAVQKMNEARAALERVQKSVAEAEAAQAAAEALRPWPPDTRLVPADHPLYPPSTPQRLHPDVASVGSFFFGLSSPIAAEGPSSLHDGRATGASNAGVDHAQHRDKHSELAVEHGSGFGPGFVPASRPQMHATEPDSERQEHDSHHGADADSDFSHDLDDDSGSDSAGGSMELEGRSESNPSSSGGQLDDLDFK